MIIVDTEANSAWVSLLVGSEYWQWS